MKTKNKIVITIFSLVCYLNIYGQNIELKNLSGKWNSHKVTTLDGKDGSELTFNKKPFEKNLMLDFIDPETLCFSINGSEKVKIKYSLNNSTLIIGHKIYTIKILTKTELVLKEERLLGNLIYLKKDDG